VPALYVINIVHFSISYVQGLLLTVGAFCSLRTDHGGFVSENAYIRRRTTRNDCGAQDRDEVISII